MIVHFPIVLSILLPIFAIGALWAIRRNPAGRVWAVPFALAVVLAGSAFVATRTGENEEERVEKVVPENVLHQHEAAAERFLVLAAIVAGVALVGLAGGVIGSAARLVATAGSLIIVFAGFQVGKAGGELVYEHNAGAAYAQNTTPTGTAAKASEGGQDEKDSDAR
jgi:hypothetical protein